MSLGFGKNYISITIHNKNNVNCFLTLERTSGKHNLVLMKDFSIPVLMPFLFCARRRPNIILVFIDDMGWGDFSCFGNKAAKTPNIDRLAEEGLRFDQFYVNSPICSPSA